MLRLITLRHTTFCGTVPDEDWPFAENSDNTHTQHSQATAILPAGFEHSTPKIERPQTHALNLKELIFLNVLF